MGGCLLLGGGGSWGGVCFPWGVSASGAVCLLLGGSASWGGIPACTEAEPPLGTESQMNVKTLPWPNFVATGKHQQKLALNPVIT